MSSLRQTDKMTQDLVPPFLSMRQLPHRLPLEAAIRIELQEGVPIMRAARTVQRRIEKLLTKQQTSGLTDQEIAELDRYEDLDDYLSFINRLIRNQVQPGQLSPSHH
jgi:hypothetical protein